MSHATSSTCHFNLSFINWARLSLLPRPPPYMSTYLLCVSIDMHSRVCKFLRVKCAKLDKSLYQEYTLTHAMREGERERSPNNWTCQLTCILVCASFYVSTVKNLAKTYVKNKHWWLKQWEREREISPATKRVNWHAFLCVQVIACQMSETWQKPLSRIHTVDAGNERGRGPGEITRQLNSRFWRWARGSWLASLGLGWQRQRQWQRF